MELAHKPHRRLHVSFLLLCLNFTLVLAYIAGDEGDTGCIFTNFCFSNHFTSSVLWFRSLLTYFTVPLCVLLFVDVIVI